MASPKFTIGQEVFVEIEYGLKKMMDWRNKTYNQV